MLLVVGRHQLLYIKNKEKRKKKKKENVFKKVIYFLLLLLFYFFKLCSKPIFSLGPSIKIAAASFLYGLCDTGEEVGCEGARLTGSGAVCPKVSSPWVLLRGLWTALLPLPGFGKGRERRQAAVWWAGRGALGPGPGPTTPSTTRFLVGNVEPVGSESQTGS